MCVSVWVTASSTHCCSSVWCITKYTRRIRNHSCNYNAKWRRGEGERCGGSRKSRVKETDWEWVWEVWEREREKEGERVRRGRKSASKSASEQVRLKLMFLSALPLTPDCPCLPACPYTSPNWLMYVCLLLLLLLLNNANICAPPRALYRCCLCFITLINIELAYCLHMWPADIIIVSWCGCLPAPAGPALPWPALPYWIAVSGHLFTYSCARCQVLYKLLQLLLLLLSFYCYDFATLHVAVALVVCVILCNLLAYWKVAHSAQNSHSFAICLCA